MMKEKRIIFVCTGNTCRSPMAEAFLKKILKDHNKEGITVDSRGISVIEPTINEKTLKSLSNFGIINYTHKPTQLLEQDIQESNLVITMTKSQKDAILRLKEYPNVFSIGELLKTQDIPDPYGLDQQTYDYVAGMIKDSCEKIYTILF